MTVADFPPLDAWLRKHNARCLWSVEAPHAIVQTWEVRGHIFLVLLYAVAPAWDIFISCESPSGFDSLLDAEKRLGLT